ncbi:MAG TPA: hypothetical protein VJP79_07530 [Nitrososphaera sp.]|nr:hypothetical protein [Nitrososphaera sp.]
MSNSSVFPAVIAGLAVGILLITLFAMLSGQIVANKSVYRGLYSAEADGSKIAINPVAIREEEDGEDCGCIVLQFWDTARFIRETGGSAVKAQFLVQNITLQKGGYAEAPLLIQHLGGGKAEHYVTVRAVPPTGYTLYPKSVAESTTEEERIEVAKTNTIIRGAIDMAEFVVPSDPVTIQVGGEEIVNVRFVVPDGVPNEDTWVPVMLEVTTESGTINPESISREDAGIDLIIVPS